MKRVLFCFILSCTALTADHFRDGMIAYKAGDFVHAKELFEAAIKKETIKLNDETVKGFEWRVQPYDDHIAPIYLASGKAGLGKTRYEFSLNGETVVSETEEAAVAMFNGGGVCELS